MIILSFGTMVKYNIHITKSYQPHTVGEYWDTVLLKANTHRKYFTNIGFRMTSNGQDDNIINTQKFKSKYTLEKRKSLELQPDTFTQDTISEQEVIYADIYPSKKSLRRMNDYGYTILLINQSNWERNLKK